MWTMRQIIMNIAWPAKKVPPLQSDLEANSHAYATPDSTPPSKQTPLTLQHTTPAPPVPQAATPRMPTPQAVTCVEPVNSLKVWVPPAKPRASSAPTDTLPTPQA